MSLSAAGAISGNPTSGGPSSFTAKATDNNGASATATFSITVYSAVTVTPTSLPGGTVGQPYGPITAGAIGGSGSVAWIATGLPAGISLGPSTGTISGTPTAAGPFTATVTATDAVTGQTGSQTYTGNISYAALTITSSGSLGTIAVGTAVSSTFAATGGKPPYTWTSTGTLPSGATLSAAGALTGTVTQAGNFTFTAQVTDAQPVTTSLTVTGSVLGITTTSLSPSATVSAAGGVTPYTFTGTGFPVRSIGLHCGPHHRHNHRNRARLCRYHGHRREQSLRHRDAYSNGQRFASFGFNIFSAERRGRDSVFADPERRGRSAALYVDT